MIVLKLSTIIFLPVRENVFSSYKAPENNTNNFWYNFSGVQV